ncbi:MAG: hypothetical protein ACEY3D_06150 [Rickettsia sp.]
MGYGVTHGSVSQEVHKVARRLIEFVKIIMEVNIRREKEKNNKT